MGLVRELMKMPIRRNPGFDYEDYARNKQGYFSDWVSRIPVDKDHPKFKEPLFRCSDFGLMHENYYVRGNGLKLLAITGKGSDFDDDIYLRESILTDLTKVDEVLKQYGFRILVLSGYRHRELQKRAIKGVKKQGRSKAQKPVEELFTHPDIYSPHMTGGAVDVEIWEISQGTILPTKLPDREKTELFYLEDREILLPLEETVRDNRRLLHNILSTEAVLGKDYFIPHPSEYWHFGRNERLAAFFAANNHLVFYDVID